VKTQAAVATRIRSRNITTPFTAALTPAASGLASRKQAGMHMPRLPIVILNTLDFQRFGRAIIRT